MTRFGSDINTALSSDGPISRENVLSWIDAAADSDLSTLSKLYRLTGEGYHRIQPELGREPSCALIQRYLLGCIRDGVTDNEEIEERYEAAESLHVLASSPPWDGRYLSGAIKGSKRNHESLSRKRRGCARRNLNRLS